MIQGAKLRDYRKPRKVSIYELAAELGVHPSTVSRMERKDLQGDEFYTAIAAIEKITKRRAGNMNELDALQGDAA